MQKKHRDIVVLSLSVVQLFGGMILLLIAVSNNGNCDFAQPIAYIAPVLLVTFASVWATLYREHEKTTSTEPHYSTLNMDAIAVPDT